MTLNGDRVKEIIECLRPDGSWHHSALWGRRVWSPR